MHKQAEYLTSFALGQLPEALSIVASFHLKACVSCSTQLADARASIDQRTAGVERPERLGGERRKSPRVPTDCPAVLTVLQPERSGHTKTRVLDASKEGLKLLVPDELMGGALVQVHMGDLFILAEVRYCRPVGAAFHAGVLIQDVFGMTC